MKRLLSRIAIPLVILGWIITGCGEQAVQPTPVPTLPPATEPLQQTDSEIIEDMVARMNAGDVEGSLAYFADDATAYIIGLPPTGMEVYAGKEQIRTLANQSWAMFPGALCLCRQQDNALVQQYLLQRAGTT